ncbi:hypothetical protein FNP_1826 [Fusobacterium polymorphum ATCC 10953]|uniref:Uncharacterized protein n=1 Tax=Fusobacterium polymorphum ATCC 10953 TaxID=393480 RepID=A5TXH3_FUSNP|nr:hypothetical protein FNP_1826 [Fusobacterium polymorphum ATCC 10953]
MLPLIFIFPISFNLSKSYSSFIMSTSFSSTALSNLSAISLKLFAIFFNPFFIFLFVLASFIAINRSISAHLSKIVLLKSQIFVINKLSLLNSL